MFWRCIRMTAVAPAIPNAITGHGYPKATTRIASAMAVTIEASEANLVERKTASQTPMQQIATSGASAKVAPPAVATIFPPF